MMMMIAHFTSRVLSALNPCHIRTIYPSINYSVYGYNTRRAHMETIGVNQANGDDDDGDDYDNYGDRYKGCPKNWQFLSNVTHKDREFWKT